MPERALILGTAGHIDHGKSTLIKQLTGTDPDRLAEEKRRGITIELGFARLALPSGRHLGVVDVPGHEKFVKHMVAGAVGVDVALLVVAADDGVMPQTIEHLAILRLLQVPHLVVALTKCDMVDTDALELARMEIEELLDTTEYAGSAVVAVSGVTGQGCDELLAALQTVVDMIDAADGDGAGADTAADMRLPIDRVFTIAGAGTVVTGTLWSGRIGVGDTPELQPAGRKLRVRAVQVHGQGVDTAYAGQRVAVNVVGASVGDIARGDVLCRTGLCKPATLLRIKLELLPDEIGVVKSGGLLHVHHAGREVTGRLYYTASAARLRLFEPLIPVVGDRFILRAPSPARTVGGGSILEVWEAPKRQAAAQPVVAARDDAAQQEARRAADAARDALLSKIVAELERAAPEPRTAADFACEDAKLLAAALGAGVTRGSIVRLAGSLYFAPAALVAAEATVREALAAAPDGLGAAALRDALGLSRKVTIAVLEHFDARGITRRVGEVRVLK
ncbi:MAG: selenocysteine-specific translation elongation factor [Actinomycetes bacterium]|jgi:selenocysteine-specific elongation factor|nr:selenocysteine-specific translation elongation factor [Actinomycetes bacterium]